MVKALVWLEVTAVPMAALAFHEVVPWTWKVVESVDIRRVEIGLRDSASAFVFA